MTRLTCILAAAGLLAACSPQTQPSDTPHLPGTAAPYIAPAQPPDKAGPLDVQPSADAYDRLNRVASGSLVDSGQFHSAAYIPDGPAEDSFQISFTAAGGTIKCTGSSPIIFCGTTSETIPRPPRPRTGPSGNWVSYITLGASGVEYGMWAGNPMVNAGSKTLDTGSAIRLGDVQCLAEDDAITCVHYPTGTGFHLGKDGLTPLKSAKPLARDARAEPRTPGSKYCGALATTSDALNAVNALANPRNIKWEITFDSDLYSCRDLQLAQATANDGPTSAHITGVASHVLAFDKGKFVGSVTSVPYYGLTGYVDDNDPTLIWLRVPAAADNGETTVKVRARYQDGRITLLDPIPKGAEAVS